MSVQNVKVYENILSLMHFWAHDSSHSTMQCFKVAGATDNTTLFAFLTIFSISDDS